MLSKTGLCHGDLHPGNVAFDSDDKIVIIDNDDICEKDIKECDDIRKLLCQIALWLSAKMFWD